MGHTFGHAGSGSPLHFGSASAEDIPGQRVEPITCCECGRRYFRPAVANRKDAPPAVCQPCREQRARVAAERAVVPSITRSAETPRVN